MGNQLIKNYDIQKDSNGVAGFSSLWRIYPGVRQDKTMQGPNTVSIFMLDKKFIDKANKAIREDLYAFLRKEPQSLAKFKQPNCLSMIEPLVEDAKNMAFVTEFVQSSLQNLINNSNISDIYSTDFEVKMHLLELLQALSFFHNDVKMAHLGVSPENIYVTANGKWKLGGMVFTTQILNDKSADSSNVDFKARTDNLIQMGPNLNFTAPEVCESPSKCCFGSDIFSLGLLIYSIFKVKADQSTGSIYCINASNMSQYRDKVGTVGQNVQKEKFFKEMPQALKNLLTKMLNNEPSLRPTVSEVLGSAWFNDPFIQTIAHLETLAQKDVSQQQLFLKGLSKILLKFEAKVIKTIILPSLMEFLKLEQLSAIIIQIIISILEQNSILSKGEFTDIVWPSIKALATGKEIPAQALYLLVSNLKILCEFISNSDLQTFLMPLILKCYECGVAKLQELALLNTEFLVKKLDFVFIKTKILPRVLKLCVDNNTDLRRNSLFCLNKIYHLFERATIIEQVIGTLEKIKKMGADAKMNIIILNIYEGISKTIGIEAIANKILPNLVCNLSDLNLSKSEFKSYLTTIQHLLKKIEEERLADDPAQTKEEESDMNKILKEIEDMDKDQSKKNNEIFAAMQGPTSSSDFDFLSIFDGGAVNVPPKSESLSLNDQNTISQSQNSANITGLGGLNQNSTNITGLTQSINKSNENIPQKPIIGQKLDSDFDFFNEIENSNKAFQSVPKPKSGNSGLFNQTVQIKKMQSTANDNNNSNLNTGQNQTIFSNLNINQKTTALNSVVNNNSSNFGLGNQQKPSITQSFNPANITSSSKGNMLNLNYDPFSELDSKPSNNNNNPFSLEPMGGPSNPSVKTNFNKPVQNQNPMNLGKTNEIGGVGWNFDDFQDLGNSQKSNPNPGPLNLNIGGMKLPQKTSSQGTNQGNKMDLGGINFGGVQQSNAPKKQGDFDFFKNAVPVEQGLKINKVNPPFKNEDLI